MNFMGLSPVELLFIGLLIILVVGPNRLPEFAAGVARFILMFRQFAEDVRQSFARAAQQIGEEPLLPREFDARDGNRPQPSSSAPATSPTATHEPTGQQGDAGSNGPPETPVEPRTLEERER
jgi:sec-independent protein translocase protein TatB